MTELLNPELPDHPSLEELEAFFKLDRYATEATRCTIVEGWKGHGVAEMQIDDIHRNAQGAVMGGAVFTLADFALAIASNIGEPPTVNLQSNIEFLRATKGSKLIATADIVKPSFKTPFYEVVVTDDLGKLIAKVTIVAYKHTDA